MEDLTGRYLKALIDSPFGINTVKEGEYLQINGLYCDDLKGEKGWVYGNSKNDVSKEFELMPIGFNPNQINTLQNCEIY